MRQAKLTSLLRVEERLLEAEYFIQRINRARDPSVGYNLNAFLSAGRSVTLLLQKEFSKVDGFAEWWGGEQAALGADPAARFFLELRNYSQKEGRVSLVGVAQHNQRSTSPLRWSYRFAGTSKAVPDALKNRDVSDCCREHLAKLAKVVLRFGDRFPFHSCPSRALTPDGVKSLDINIDEAFEILGFPSGWTRFSPDHSSEYLLEVLRRHVDAVDFRALQRLSKFKPRHTAVGNEFGERLATSMVSTLERHRNKADEGNVVVEFVLSELRNPKKDNKT